MSQGICETLNMPHLEDVLKELAAATPVEDMENEPEIDEVSPMVAGNAHQHIVEQAVFEDGRDHADGLEELYEDTLKHSRDLMDLGFNVDVRSARGIFEVAGTMYKNAIDAKNSKRDFQLKMMKMLLDKRKLDLQERQITGSTGPVIKGDGVMIEDRNALIEMLRKTQNKVHKQS